MKKRPMAKLFGKISAKFFPDSIFYGPKYYYSIKQAMKSIDGKPAGDYKITVSNVTEEDSSYEDMYKFLSREIDLLKQEHESDPRGLSDEKIEKHNMLINIRDHLTKVYKL